MHPITFLSKLYRKRLEFSSLFFPATLFQLVYLCSTLRYLTPLNTYKYWIYLSNDFIVGIVGISLLKFLCHCIKVLITLLLIWFITTYFYIYLHSSLGYWYKIGTEMVQNAKLYLRIIQIFFSLSIIHLGKLRYLPYAFV